MNFKIKIVYLKKSKESIKKKINFGDIATYVNR